MTSVLLRRYAWLSTVRFVLQLSLNCPIGECGAVQVSAAIITDLSRPSWFVFTASTNTMQSQQQQQAAVATPAGLPIPGTISLGHTTRHSSGGGAGSDTQSTPGSTPLSPLMSSPLPPLVRASVFATPFLSIASQATPTPPSSTPAPVASSSLKHVKIYKVCAPAGFPPGSTATLCCLACLCRL